MQATEAMTLPEQAVPLEPIADSAERSKGAASPAIAGIVKLASTLSPDDRLRIMAGLWASLPTWHSGAPTSAQLPELEREIEDYDLGESKRFGWEVVRRLIAAGCPNNSSKIYSAPRRFDLSTIFVVTLAYSLLFGLMAAASFPPVASAVIAGFISFVAIGQAFLFGGRQPRTASLIVGTVIYVAATFVWWFGIGPRMYDSGVILAMLAGSIITGAILGYIAGVFVGGVFLISDKLRKWFSKKRRETFNSDGAGLPVMQPEGDSPWAN